MNRSPAAGGAALRRSSSNPSWSILAHRRSSRPIPPSEKSGVPSHNCPFCEGNEADTEPEIDAERDPHSGADTPGWRMRVVPNKYPALTLPADAVDAGEGAPYEQMAAHGLHEVIIETPEHGLTLSDFPAAAIEQLLHVYGKRLRALRERDGIRSVQIFRNEGRAAGASQPHPHSQVLALPVVPLPLARELETSVRHFETTGGCLTCTLIARERKTATRLVAEHGRFAAFTSYAPRFPYEIWIAATTHDADFGAMPREALPDLAGLLKKALTALKALLGAFPFNLVLHTAPAPVEPWREAFHWRLEILPRLTVPSGFELGSGISIVAVPPEEAAARLREALSEPR